MASTTPTGSPSGKPHGMVSSTPPGSPPAPLFQRPRSASTAQLAVSDDEKAEVTLTNANISGPATSYVSAGAGAVAGFNHLGSNQEGHVSAEVNTPNRFELFLLGDGEKKVTEEPDTRTPNTSIFTFNKEDHTLANLLRAYLLKDSHVSFAGYRVPHPMFPTFELRIQTDGDITPKEALINCCQGLVGNLGHLSREFTKEFELRKMVQGEEGNGV